MFQHRIAAIRILASTLALITLIACSSSKETLLDRPTLSKSQGISFKNFAKIDDGSVELPNFPFQKWTMDNGLTVYFSPDPELPLVSSSLLIPGGSFWESPQERGLYQALGDNMRAGGAGELSPQALDRELEQYAASISTNFGQEYGSISSNSLSTDFDKIFGVMTEVLLRPRFDRERLSLWKGQTIEGIKRRVDDPGTVAALSMRELLIGGSSYGAVVSSQDITGITRQKLRSLHHRAVIPNKALLAISGNITRVQAEETVQKYLGSWQKAPQDLPAAPAFPPQKNTGIYFIEQPLKQATILMGHLGPARLSKDQYAIEIFNQYFGSGGFGSVLMKKIRTEMGLAYGVFGSILPGLQGGRALINLQTKPESAGPAIVESLKSLQGLQNKEIAQESLLETTKSITNTFVFNFTSPSQVLGRKVQLDLLGYPKDFDQGYLNKIRSTTPIELQAVAQTRWNFDELVIVVVGSKAALNSIQAHQGEFPAPIRDHSIQFGSFNEQFEKSD